MIKGSCVCGVVFVRYGSETMFHADVMAFLNVVVLLKTSVVLHYKPMLVEEKWVRRQVILHSFGLKDGGTRIDHGER